MKFRKKPVEIEAVQYTGSVQSIIEIIDFMKEVPEIFQGKEIDEKFLKIKTLEGDQIASVGDYIIKGIANEFYPCKPDIFEKTYTTGSIGEISDGYHTFNELYYHRMVLFAVICNSYRDKSWKSWKHHDGTMYEDYFIVGIETDAGQYSYHYHKDEWRYFEVKEVEFAPEWDGHQPSDIERLLTL